MAEKKSLGKEFTKGLIKENPVLRLGPGPRPTPAGAPPCPPPMVSWAVL